MNESSRMWHTRVPSTSRTIGPSLCECTELSATTARNCHSRPPSVEAHSTTRWRRRQARRRGRMPSTSGSSRVPSGSCTSRRPWKPVTAIGCGSLQVRPPSALRNRKLVPVLPNPEALISRVPSGSLLIRGIAQWQVDSSGQHPALAPGAAQVGAFTEHQARPAPGRVPGSLAPDTDHAPVVAQRDVGVRLVQIVVAIDGDVTIGQTVNAPHCPHAVTSPVARATVSPNSSWLHGIGLFRSNTAWQHDPRS